ncbi:MAG: sigma-70 family RNA polymerase sigma factor [Polyangiaceae bacterium]
MSSAWSGPGIQRRYRRSDPLRNRPHPLFLCEIVQQIAIQPPISHWSNAPSFKQCWRVATPPGRNRKNAKKESSPGAEYRAIVRREWRFVREVARCIGVPERHRDDIVIEVFLRFERHTSTITGPQVIRAWLRTTAVYVSYEYFDARPTRYEVPASIERLRVEGEIPSPEESYLEKEAYQNLLEHVNALEPRRRAVFRAFAVEGRTVTQIAAELGIPEATAHNRLRLARRDLSESIARAQRVDERKLRGRGLVLFPPAKWLFTRRIPRLLLRLASALVSLLPRSPRGAAVLAVLLLAGALSDTALAPASLLSMGPSPEAPSVATPMFVRPNRVESHALATSNTHSPNSERPFRSRNKMTPLDSEYNVSPSLASIEGGLLGRANIHLPSSARGSMSARRASIPGRACSGLRQAALRQLRRGGAAELRRRSPRCGGASIRWLRRWLPVAPVAVLCFLGLCSAQARAQGQARSAGTPPVPVAASGGALPRLVELDYSRESPACPPASYFTDTVEARVSYVPFVRQAPALLRVEVRRTEAGFRARWEVRDPTGQLRSGEYPPPGRPALADCFDTVHGLGLAFAIELEPVRARPPAEPRARSPSETSPHAHGVKPDTRRTQEMDVTISVGAYALMTVGLTANVAPGFGIAGDVRGELWSVGLELRGVPPSMIEAKDPIEPGKETYLTTADLSQWTAVLAPCFRWKVLAGCAVAQGGIVYLSDDYQSSTQPTFNLGPRFGVEVPFAERFAVFGMAEALFALTRPGIFVTDTIPPGGPFPNVQWDHSIVTGNFAAGLAVHFR